MSGTEFGFKGLLPTWDVGVRTPASGAAQTRTDAERAFQNVSLTPPRQTPSTPVWPSQPATQSTAEAPGTTDVSGYDGERTKIFNDPGFLALKGRITG